MRRSKLLSTLILLAGLCMSPALLVAQAPGESPATRLDLERASRPPASGVVMRPGDVLQVGVWPDETLSGKFVVEETGYVYLPFLGRVRAAGTALDSLRSQLREGYAEVMKNPVVTVTPLFHVGVQGAVRGPGIYQITPSNTVIDVITMAGGFAPNANRQKIRILRQDEGRIVEVNVKRTLETGAGMESLQLRSGDQVMVPVKRGGITFGGVLDFVRTASVIALIVDRFAN